MHLQTVLSTHREYPLRKQVFESWKDIGLEALPELDGNAGNPIGLADLQESRRQGRREIASVVYPLDGVTVKTNTTVAKVIIGKKNACNPQGTGNNLEATGIKMADGTEIDGKEIILSAGAIRTPQLLMLSGVGPKDELAKHKIHVLLDQPEVGKNFVDHSLLRTAWTVKDPSKGYMPGSGNPLFKERQYGWGTPTDCIVTSGITDKEGLAKAIETDEGKKPDASHPLLKDGRVFTEHIGLYAGSTNGSIMAFITVNLLPTSRGTVMLASADINDPPLIDPNYHATEVDKFVGRDGIRLQVKFAGSNKTIMGREILDGELGAPGFDKPFTVDSTDAYIDSRMAAGLA